MRTRDMGIFRKFRSEPFNKSAYEVAHFRDAFDVTAPYQRGHVWAVPRQRRLIESMMMCIPIGSILINERPGVYDRRFVIDGKQRLTALWDFVDGKFAVPAAWFGAATSGLVGDVLYPTMPEEAQRMVQALYVPVLETHLSTIDEEADLFDRINFAGVPQGASDFADQEG